MSESLSERIAKGTHPKYFTRAGKFFHWHSGQEVTAPKTRTLVQASGISEFWTWIDRESGERCWEIAS